MNRIPYRTFLTISGLLCLILMVSACTSTKSTTIRLVVFDENLQLLTPDAKEFVRVEAKQKLQSGDLLVSSSSAGFLLKFSDGTKLRSDKNTVLSLLELNAGEGAQAARFKLSSGTVWVLLKGREIEIQMPAGNATVSGSMMSASVDPSTLATELTCLEGDCTLSNDQGSTAMEGGQAATIAGIDQAPSSAESMTQTQLDTWEDSNPEVKFVVKELADTVSKEAAPTTEAVTANASASCPYSGMGSFQIHFENNCVGGETSTEPTRWEWWFYWMGQWYIRQQIEPGQVLDVCMPSGYYNWVSESAYQNGYPVFRKGWYDQTYAPGASLSVKMCPDDPSLPTGTLTEPLKYYLANNCVGDSSDHANTVWHWSFVNVRGANQNDPLLDPLEVVIPLGEYRSGELPPGLWLERDWTENGSVDNPTSLRNGGYDIVNLCPDNPHFPEQPEK